MKRTIWFISDTHFNHKNILNFKKEDGSCVREGFSSVEEMNQCMVDNWNESVKDQDIIYHLGDVCFGGKAKTEAILSKLNGRKRLIMGNHDCLDVRFYRNYFQKIMSWRTFDKDVTGCDKTFVACHYPLHKSSFEKRDRGIRFCVHGHTHTQNVDENGYINVCVEQTGYKPVAMDELLDKMV